ncbi:hypothetical protein CIPAW_01G071500 [Carya illinoinensis]|uniref:Uncharacterized protein n=1 Tax=Carya illinoinensis TaxID=32201 RepID=A0A8T1RJG2_CARIL|nr:hypothetical protein CIPAW_01G071500 [Carya illinoinensis]
MQRRSSGCEISKISLFLDDSPPHGFSHKRCQPSILDASKRVTYLGGEKDSS